MDYMKIAKIRDKYCILENFEETMACSATRDKTKYSLNMIF